MIGSDDELTPVAQHHGFVVPNESSSVARVLGVTGE